MFHSFKSNRQHPAIPSPLAKFALRGGTQTFIPNHRIVLLKNKCSVKMYPQIVLLTENNYYTNIISLVMLLVAPISGLTVKISRFS